MGTSPDHSILVTINFGRKLLDGWARQDLRCERGSQITESILFTILAREEWQVAGSITYTTQKHRITP
jgi:hypothetical protein